MIAGCEGAASPKLRGPASRRVLQLDGCVGAVNLHCVYRRQGAAPAPAQFLPRLLEKSPPPLILFILQFCDAADCSRVTRTCSWQEGSQLAGTTRRYRSSSLLGSSLPGSWLPPLLLLAAPPTAASPPPLILLAAVLAAAPPASPAPPLLLPGCEPPATAPSPTSFPLLSLSFFVLSTGAESPSTSAIRCCEDSSRASRS